MKVPRSANEVLSVTKVPQCKTNQKLWTISCLIMKGTKDWIRLRECFFCFVVCCLAEIFQHVNKIDRTFQPYSDEYVKCYISVFTKIILISSHSLLANVFVVFVVVISGNVFLSNMRTY